MGKHFIITNRQILPKQGNKPERINQDGMEPAGHNLRFASVDTEKDYAIELIPEPETEAEMSFAGNAEKQELKGSAWFFREIYDSLKSKSKANELLFFIHGFNNDLDDVKKLIQQLHELYVVDPACPIETIVIFSWPAKGPLIPTPFKQYWDDRLDAEVSGRMLARLQGKMIDFFAKFFHGDTPNDECGKRMHLMCHSMGNYVLECFLAEWQKNNKVIPQIFHEMLLVAADVDYANFEKGKPFENLLDLGKRVHILYHNDDKALAISKRTKHGGLNRLGQEGRREQRTDQKNIIEYDLTHVSDDLVSVSEKIANHAYFVTSTEAANLIKLIISQRQKA